MSRISLHDAINLIVANNRRVRTQKLYITVAFHSCDNYFDRLILRLIKFTLDRPSTFHTILVLWQATFCDFLSRTTTGGM